MYRSFSSNSARRKMYFLCSVLLSAALVFPPVQGKAQAAGSAGVLEFESTSVYVLESEGTAYLTVKRTGGSEGEVSVHYTAFDGSASQWSDYVAVSDTLVFADGETSKVIAVPIDNDSYSEEEEYFTVGLSNPTGGATLGPASGVDVAIGDDDYWIPDPPGVLQLESGSYTVHEGESYASINVYRTSGAGGQVTVDYGVSGGSATEGQDFGAASGSLVFNEGETWKVIDVPILDDYEVEGDESFNVSLGNTTGGATVGVLSSASVTILDNDVPVPNYGQLEFETGIYGVNESDGSITLTVLRTNGYDGEVSVDYSAGGGSASGGSDYEAVSGTLTFAEGEYSKTVTIPVYDDSDIEGDENFSVTLSNPAGGAEIGSLWSADVTITDNDYWIPDPPGVLQLESGSYTVHEGESFATFNVYRTEGAGGQVTVDYGVGGGSATEGQDYATASGSLVFNEGETWKVIEVPLLDDYDYEGDETFSVSLGNTTGGAVVGSLSSAQVTIIDNEVPPSNYGQLAFESGTYGVKEGDGSITFTVARTNGSDGEVTVDYATGNGTAVSGSDFTAASGTLTFAVGEIAKTVTVQVYDDSLIEGDESFTVALSNPTGGAELGSVSTADVKITDNDYKLPDPTGVIQLDSTLPIVSEGKGTVALKVLRQGGSKGVISVKYAAVSGTAAAGSDFAAASGLLTFAEGETVKTIPITLVNDTTKEQLEYFSVKLYDASYLPALGTATVVFVIIQDND